MVLPVLHLTAVQVSFASAQMDGQAIHAKQVVSRKITLIYFVIDMSTMPLRSYHNQLVQIEKKKEIS